MSLFKSLKNLAIKYAEEGKSRFVAGVYASDLQDILRQHNNEITFWYRLFKAYRTSEADDGWQVDYGPSEGYEITFYTETAVGVDTAIRANGSTLEVALQEIEDLVYGTD